MTPELIEFILKFGEVLRRPKLGGLRVDWGPCLSELKRIIYVLFRIGYREKEIS